MSARRILAVVGLVLLMGTLVALSAITPPEAPPGSARSAEPSGLLALYLLLEELGFRPEVHEGSIGELVEGAEAAAEAGAPVGLLLLPRVPVGFEAGVDPADPLVRARAGSEDAWRSYRTFAERGGVLLLSRKGGGEEFLTAGLGFEDPCAGMPTMSGSFQWTPPLAVRSAPARQPGAEPGGGRGCDELVDAEQAVLARRYSVGRGAVVVSAAPARHLRNGHIDEEGSAVFQLRLVQFVLGEHDAPVDRAGVPIRFAEFALRSSHAGGSAASIAFGAGRLFTWHLLAFAAVLVWWLAWSREFPRDPEPHDTLAPLLRASATAGLFARRGQLGALADWLRAGAFAALGGLRGRRQAGEAPRDRRRPSPQEAAALARRHGDAARAEAWVELLVTRPVEGLEELVQLDRELRELERSNRHRGAAGSPSRAASPVQRED